MKGKTSHGVESRLKFLKLQSTFFQHDGLIHFTVFFPCPRTIVPCVLRGAMWGRVSLSNVTVNVNYATGVNLINLRLTSLYSFVWHFNSVKFVFNVFRGVSTHRITSNLVTYRLAVICSLCHVWPPISITLHTIPTHARGRGMIIQRATVDSETRSFQLKK